MKLNCSNTVGDLSFWNSLYVFDHLQENFIKKFSELTQISPVFLKADEGDFR